MFSRFKPPANLPDSNALPHQSGGGVADQKGATDFNDDASTDAGLEYASRAESPLAADTDLSAGAAPESAAVQTKRPSVLAALIGLIAGFILAAGLWAPIDNLDETDNPFAPALDVFATFMRGEDASKSAMWHDLATQYKNKDQALSKPQQQLIGFLAKKYRIASTEVRKMVAAAYAAGAYTKLDPLLILAVMSIESNLNPVVESAAGAQGLMQIMPKVHANRFDQYGGLGSIFNIDTNVLVGARILQDCIKLGGNTVEGGLKCYVGASGPSDGGYGAKVLAEQARLARAAGGDFDFTAPKHDLELKPSTELIPIVKLDKGEEASNFAQTLTPALIQAATPNSSTFSFVPKASSVSP